MGKTHEALERADKEYHENYLKTADDSNKSVVSKIPGKFPNPGIVRQISGSQDQIDHLFSHRVGQDDSFYQHCPWGRVHHNSGQFCQHFDSELPAQCASD